jgi:hypothetical protein
MAEFNCVLPLQAGEAGRDRVAGEVWRRSKDFTIWHSHLYARERVGYSDDSAQLFYANSKVVIEEIASGWNSKHDMLFQLWFTPDSGEAAQKLVERRQTISGWER